MNEWYDWGVKVTSRRTAQAINGRICLVYAWGQCPRSFLESQVAYLWSNRDFDQFTFASWRDAQCIDGCFLLAKEDSKGTGNAFDAEQIVPANGFNHDCVVNLETGRACWRAPLS